MFRASLALIAAGLLAVPVTRAAQCTVESAERRVALLELYTSEGCSSCPPADRWISALPAHGLGVARILALGFHVGYSNDLGWNDPFAKPQYSARQRAAGRRNEARAVYTPQLLLNGKDYRPGPFRDDFADRVRALNRDKPKARIRMRLASAAPGTLLVKGTVLVPDAAEQSAARAYIALYFVVRALTAPIPVNSDGHATIDHRFVIDASWKPADLHAAAFVQNDRTGDVLQALALPNCALDR